jgi:polyisoprenoid-binding protein YceI
MTYNYNWLAGKYCRIKIQIHKKQSKITHEKDRIRFPRIFVLTAFTTGFTTWQNDDPHSQLGFTVTHLGIADVSGTFNDFDVTVKSTKPDFSDASFELTAKTASIDTRVEARNNHLKSPDFFDVANYPALNFKSTEIKKAGENKYTLAGDLTIQVLQNL